MVGNDFRPFRSNPCLSRCGSNLPILP